MTEDISSLFVTDEDGNVITDVNGEGTISLAYLSAMRTIKDEGLEVIMRNHYETADYFNRLSGSDIAQLQSIVSGYYMCDEPSVSAYGKHLKIDDFTDIVNWYNSFGGDAFFHVNLLQSYGVDIVEKDMTYAEYVSYYVENVLSKVNGRKSISTDYYPLATNGSVNYVKSGYLNDLFLLANTCKDLKADGQDVFLNLCVQLCGYEDLNLRKIACLGDVRLQLYLAIAFGATSFEYYPYVDYSGDGSGILATQNPQ